MSASLMPVAKQQYFDSQGLPLAGGKVYTYAAGTTTPLATYSDASGSTPNANPVILDSRGEASIFFGSNNYKVVLQNSAGASIWTADNIGASASQADLASAIAAYAASAGSSLVGYLSSGVGAAASTVQTKLRESVSVKDFGAKGDGVTDDTAAIQAAANSGALNILIPAVCAISSAITISTTGQRIYSNGGGGLFLKAASNSAILIVNASYVTVEGLEINGNKANQSVNYVTHKADGIGSGVTVNLGFSNVNVRFNYIHDVSVNGIMGLGNNAYCDYSANVISNCGLQGITPTFDQTKPFTYGKIQRNTITNVGIAPNAANDVSNGGDGIGVVGIQHCSITDNVIQNVWTAGIGLEAGCAYVTVAGNVIDCGRAFSALVSGAPTTTGTNAQGPSQGIQINDCWNITVTGNTIENSWLGVGVSGGDNTRAIAISGNTIRRSISAGIQAYSSAGTSGRWSDIVISGNMVSNTYGTPIRAGQLGGVVIEANLISGVNIGNCTAQLYGYGILLYNNQYFSSVINNVVNKSSIGSDAATGFMNVGVGEIYFGGGTPQQNIIKGNRINSPAYYDVVALPALAIVNSYPSASVIELVTRTNATPATGFWTNSQVNFRPNASAGSPAADFCVTAGQFGTQTCTVNMVSGSNSITNFSTMAGFFDGMQVSVAGAGPAAAALVGYLYNCNPVTATASLIVSGAAQNAGTTVTGAVMTLVNPTFKTQGNLA